MAKAYRIIFETFDLTEPKKILRQETLLKEQISKPTDILDFSLNHYDQIQLLKSALDNILPEKAALINSDLGSCPSCSGEIIKQGNRKSTLHDVFSDHDVKMQRVKCSACGFEPASTVRTFLKGHTMSADLLKIQSELGADNTFRDSEEIFNKFSGKLRKINNHNRIKLTTESIGRSLKDVNQSEKEMIKTKESLELILNVDGGHIKSKSPEQRSFEALTSVIYNPEALASNPKGTRNHLTQKSCSASALDDTGSDIITSTIISAIKEGMTENTHITALADGASNCWNVIDSLEPMCKKITPILDWFHLSMKMENIALPEKMKIKFKRIKWHLWRGNSEAALIRLHQLIENTVDKKITTKVNKFIIYIKNNLDKIINYRERQKEGLVFTSNLAESTVESLINQRCKGQQHMKWTREGLDPILQLRAQIHSKDWNNKWKTVVLASI